MKMDLTIILILLSTAGLVKSRYKMFYIKNINVNSGFLFEGDTPMEVICSWITFISIVLGFLVHWWMPFLILVVSLCLSELLLMVLRKLASVVSGTLVVVFSLLLILQLWRIYLVPGDHKENLGLFMLHTFTSSE